MPVSLMLVLVALPAGATPYVTIRAGPKNTAFAGSVGSGDIDGDGLDDVVVSRNSIMPRAGFLGYRGGLGPDATRQDWSVWLPYPNDGGYVAMAGDVDDDGYADVLASSPQYDDGPLQDAGAVVLYLGSPAGMAGPHAWEFVGPRAKILVGSSISAAGDVNGDGYDDVIVGCAGQFDPVRGPRAWVFHGGPAGLEPTPAWSAGDEVGGRSFGQLVAGGGDVNGDGFDDVIVGFPDWRNPGAAVFHGSPGGLGPTPDWMTYGGKSESHFGQAASAAGDVNGDGFGDIVIGAYAYGVYPFDIGSAFVYHGSAAGLEPDPAWVASGSGARRFGWAVASAGDLDHDGYDEVMVGAPGDNDGGNVRVFAGSPAGLGSEALITLVGPERTEFGYALATGDIDGDGNVDILVGDYHERSRGVLYAYLSTLRP